MSSVNKVILLATVGREPELRYTPSGAAVCNASMATNRTWKSKDSGERQEETEWHRVVFYDRLAEVAGEYLKKGKPVYIEGRLKTRKWQDKEGKDQYTTEIIAEQMQLLGGREGGQGGSNEQGASESRGAGENGRAGGRQGAGRGEQAPMRNQSAGRADGRSGGGRTTGARAPAMADGDLDDDIPFAKVADWTDSASDRKRQRAAATR